LFASYARNPARDTLFRRAGALKAQSITVIV